MVHCGSAFEPGASGLPYYCTPPVCVLAVSGALAVWWQNIQKKILRADSATLRQIPDVIGRLVVWRHHTHNKNQKKGMSIQVQYILNSLGGSLKERNISCNAFSTAWAREG